MSGNKIELRPITFLDENWERLTPKPGYLTEPPWELTAEVMRSQAGILIKEEPTEEETDLETQKEEWIKRIRSTRIEIAEIAETRVIGTDYKYTYLESEMGMNIIVPKGRIKELRFHASLLSGEEVVALDGFPKDEIEEKAIVSGTIKLAINKSFKFIPVIGPIISDILEIDLNPWDFKIGKIKKVNVDFSGGKTSTPEWYFKENGFKNDLKVALIIRKPKKAKRIVANVWAGWIHDPGILKKATVGTDYKEVEIEPSNE
jgi:hypothetical protein